MKINIVSLRGLGYWTSLSFWRDNVYFCCSYFGNFNYKNDYECSAICWQCSHIAYQWQYYMFLHFPQTFISLNFKWIIRGSLQCRFVPVRFFNKTFYEIRANKRIIKYNSIHGNSWTVVYTLWCVSYESLWINVHVIMSPVRFSELQTRQ